MWLEFTGPELWLKPGGADADTTLSLRLDATGLATSVVTVPAVAPDSVPAGMYADSNIVPLVDGDQVKLVKNIVLVAFNEGADVAQRGAAITSIGGVVVGGRPTVGGDGIYFVRTPTSGPSAVMSAVRALDLLSQVAAASPEVVSDDGRVLDYRVPRDSVAVGQWSIRPEVSTSDANWAFERVSAPLAWGCSVGDQSVGVGVIDAGFHQIADLTPNVIGAPVYDDPSNPERHGTAVTSIVGAEGNNDSGMAGMMWHSSLRLYNRLRGSDGSTLQFLVSRDIALMAQAALEGVRVINLSGNAGVEPLSMSDTANAAAAREYVAKLAAAQIHRLDARGFRPLFVVSAGDVDFRRGHPDSRWNAYPILADSFPDRVIVVASTTPADELEGVSKRGRLVTLAAPGENVLALDQRNTIAPFSATSAAAPLVTGTAGLLFSFDPSLTAAQVKDLIVRGAVRGGRRTTLENYPILNAYESMKLAAMRRGAPLCDNRVWELNGQVVARRNRAFPSEDEVLFTINEPVGFLAVAHGGTRIDLFRTNAFRTTAFLRGAAGAWTETSNYSSLPFPVRGGSANSMERLSHGGDSAVTVVQQGDGSFSVHVQDLLTNIDRVIGSVSPSAPGSGSDASFCMLLITNSDGSSCVDQRTFTVDAVSYNATPSFSPVGDRILVALNARHFRLTDNQTFDCTQGGGGTFTCRRLSFVNEDVGTEIWSMPIAGGTPTRLWGSTGFAIYDMALSESGQELIAQQGAMHLTSTTSTNGSVPGSQTWTDCELKFYSTTGLVLQSVPNTAACFGYPGNGTFSPMVAPVAPVAVTADQRAAPRRRAAPPPRNR
jgi:subtilisin family serine protease